MLFLTTAGTTVFEASQAGYGPVATTLFGIVGIFLPLIVTVLKKALRGHRQK